MAVKHKHRAKGPKFKGKVGDSAVCTSGALEEVDAFTRLTIRAIDTAAGTAEVYVEPDGPVWTVALSELTVIQA